MAEITSEAAARKRPRIRPIRLDMTPLVDLGFLLLSFFILTTTMRKEQALDVLLPTAGPGAAKEQALTFLLAGRDECYAYAGKFDVYTTHLQRLGMDQVRVLLNEAKHRAEPICLVRTHPSAKYAAVVHLLDELAQHDISRYAISDSFPPAELALLNGTREHAAHAH